MMPGIEPNRPELVTAQVALHQIHERTFTHSPLTGNSDGQRRLCCVVAQIIGQTERRLLKA